jgi:hypothetical protein
MAPYVDFSYVQLRTQPKQHVILILITHSHINNRHNGNLLMILAYFVIDISKEQYNN